MDRLKHTLQKDNILSVYYTAGYPSVNDTLAIAENLQSAGVQMIEIGFPYSDPVADGPVIQESSGIALANGMNVQTLFEQLNTLRTSVHIPVVLMGYLNPALQFGMENFLKSCKAVGIDGLILPDLPLEVYNKHYKSLFEEYGISMIFIITPETNAARIQEIDQASSSFIYAVSSSSITGKALDMNEERLNYFKRLKSLQTQHPILLGFGIRDRAGFVEACSYTKGGIIGSACIEFIKKNGIHKLNEFVNGIIES